MNEFKVETTQQLASHLRSLRRSNQLTQSQLGTRLNVEQARIAKIERNPGSISVDQLLAILNALDAVVLIQRRSARKVTRTPHTSVDW
jgi:HTH-type transcriptional regulator/antitoxin HipB